MSFLSCRVCGSPITKMDARRTRCDKPECRHRNLHTERPELTVRFCKVCGRSIPKGERRSVYCGQECGTIGTKRLKAQWDKTRRATRATATRGWVEGVG